MRRLARTTYIVLALVGFAGPAAARSTDGAAARTDQEFFTRRGVVATTERLFGDLSSGMADAIADTVDRYGEPDGYIFGEEFGAAFIGGLRYGRGVLVRRTPSGIDGDAREIYWRGPSAGPDIGASAGKSAFLVYNLSDEDHIYRRFPRVDGQLYVGAGAGIAFGRSDSITLVPVYAGIGLRGGANLGYIRFSRTPSWLPF